MKTREVQKERAIMALDVESDGLHGRIFAIGAVVYNEKGVEVGRFSRRTSSLVLRDSWTCENVLPAVEEIRSVDGWEALMFNFGHFYKYMCDLYEVRVLWYRGYLLEGFLFRILVSLDAIERTDIPYLPIEVASYLEIAGYPGDKMDDYLDFKGIKIEGYGVRHHPVYDCVAAYKAYESLREELQCER